MNEHKDEIEVLGEYLLIKQIMRLKKSSIILNQATDEKERFDFYMQVVQKGSDVTKAINIGDTPIFGQYGKPSVVKVIEKTTSGMISLAIYHQTDLVGIDKIPNVLTEEDIVPL